MAITAKYCIQCSRLLSLSVVECECGGKEFIEVILDYVEGQKED